MNRERLRVKPFNLSIILAIWFFAFLIPFLSGKLLINFIKQEIFKNSKIEAFNRLNKQIEEYEKNCLPVNYLSRNLQQAEKAVGLPANSNLRLNKRFLKNKNIFAKLIRQIQLKTGCKPLLLISAEDETKVVKKYSNKTDFPDYSSPGRSASRMLINKLIQLNRPNESKQFNPKKQNLSNKLLKHITHSLTGNYLNPLEQSSDIAVGFLDKLEGHKIFSVKRFWFDRKSHCVFADFAIFSESQLPLHRILKQAKSLSTNSEFKAEIVVKKASFSNFYRLNGANKATLYSPASYKILRAGSHRKKDILRALFSRGLMNDKPSRTLFLKLTTKLKQMGVEKIDRFYSLSGIFACFLFIIAMQQIHSQTTIKTSIRNKLITTLLLNVMLPGFAFIFTTFNYLEARSYLVESEQLKNQQSNLKLLELTIKSKDQVVRNKLRIQQQPIEANIHANKNVIKKILKKFQTDSFFGLVFIRNDGLVIENIDYNKLRQSKCLEKYKLLKKIIFASIYKFIDLSNFPGKGLRDALIAEPEGKQIMAIARNALTRVDLEFFSQYEGKAYSTSHEVGNLRIIIYRYVNREKQILGHLITIEDLGKVVKNIIADLSKNLNFYRKKSTHGKILTRLVLTEDIEATQTSFKQSFPQNYNLSKIEKQLLNKVTTGKSNAELTHIDKNGFTTVMSARKISGFPLIAFSHTRLTEQKLLREKLDLVILILVLYYLVIAALITNMLSQLLTKPVIALKKAGQLLESGKAPYLYNSYKNELGKLTNEFNEMVKGMSERERLTRFTSKEALSSISENEENFSGRKVCQTIVFCHLRGFNQLGQILAPQQLFDFLNNYFSLIEPVIEKYNGQIDKYINDAVMAVFHDNDDRAAAAVNACKSALEINDLIKHSLKKPKELKNYQIQTGTGISTGQVIAGKIGASSGRQDFTVIGDRVNYSARLESLSQSLDQVAILIDENTHNLLPASFKTSFYGSKQVKGKTSKEKIYILNSYEK
jgi:class 3 adenylate cyclase